MLKFQMYMSSNMFLSVENFNVEVTFWETMWEM
jgi:hypothetical protein